MKPLRTAIPVLALALAAFGLTGCADSDACDDDAARPVPVRYEPAGYAAGVKPPPPAPKPAPKAPTIHTDNDCGDDD